MTDKYLTLGGPSEGDYKEKGSKFLAYAFPVYSEEEVRGHLDVLKKLHPKARHHCFAYRLGMDGNQYRANDDGEPSGTAGKPMLGQIDSFGLTNVLVVAVRYFGGTKLGVPGLIAAYKACAFDALQQAAIVERRLCEVHRIVFGYEKMPQVMNAVKGLEINVLNQKFEDSCALEIALPQSEAEGILLGLKAAIAQVPLEMAKSMDELEGVEIVFDRLA
jgi:uncharacterized YigZ family protein